MKKLILLITVIMFSCSENSETVKTDNTFIEVETVCKSGNVRTYEITLATKNSYVEFFDKHGIDCTWIEFETTSGDTKKGYFVRYKD